MNQTVSFIKKESNTGVMFDIKCFIEELTLEKHFYIGRFTRKKKLWTYNIEVKIDKILLEQNPTIVIGGLLKVEQQGSGLNIHFIYSSPKRAYEKHNKKLLSDGIEFCFDAARKGALESEEEYIEMKKRFEEKEVEYETPPIKIYHGGGCSPK